MTSHILKHSSASEMTILKEIYCFRMLWRVWPGVSVTIESWSHFGTGMLMRLMSILQVFSSCSSHSEGGIWGWYAWYISHVIQGCRHTVLTGGPRFCTQYVLHTDVGFEVVSHQIQSLEGERGRDKRKTNNGGWIKNGQDGGGTTKVIREERESWYYYIGQHWLGPDQVQQFWNPGNL
jgi:hypothetical protein